MTTAGPAAQASTTVSVQDARVFSPGQQASQLEAHAAVPGLGNVTATTVTVQQGSPSQELLVVVQGLNLTTGTPKVVLVQPPPVGEPEPGLLGRVRDAGHHHVQDRDPGPGPAGRH